MSDVAIASLSNSDDNAITTQTTFARDDKERHCEVPKARHHIGQWSTLSCHCERPTGASQSHYRRVKKAAFTLAEVLITLAIIGIVAVLTIPTLISDYQEHRKHRMMKDYYLTTHIKTLNNQQQFVGSFHEAHRRSLDHYS